MTGTDLKETSDQPPSSEGDDANERAPTERMSTDKVRELIERSKEGAPSGDD